MNKRNHLRRALPTTQRGQDHPMLLMHVRDRRLHQPCPGLPVNIYMLRTDLIRSVAGLDEDAAAAGCLRFTTAACDGVPLPLTTEP
jgi:hypothetical protein